MHLNRLTSPAAFFILQSSVNPKSPQPRLCSCGQKKAYESPNLKEEAFKLSQLPASASVSVIPLSDPLPRSISTVRSYSLTAAP